MILARRYKFEVADNVGESPAPLCWVLDGNRYRLHACVIEIRIDGGICGDGLVADYDVIDATVKPIIRLVNRRDLNSLHKRCSTKEAAAVADNPTAELLLAWFAVRLGLVASVRSPGADLPSTLRLESLILEEDDDTRLVWFP